MSFDAPQAPAPAQPALPEGPEPRSVEEVRSYGDAARELLNADLPPVGAVHDDVVVYEPDGARVTADVVCPVGDGPHPVLVFLHGGGWVGGSPKVHRKVGFRFAEAGFVVVNVDYRLAPEAPFPAAYDDCVAAVRWAARVAPQYGGDPARLAVGGDSAGGNLAAAVAVGVAGDPDVRVRAALLMYGVYDMGRLPRTTVQPSTTILEIVVGAYLGSHTDLTDPRVSPALAADRMPPSYVVVGSADSLTGQAALMASALEQAGVPHRHVVVDGAEHGFVQVEMLPHARPAIDDMARFLREHLPPGGDGPSRLVPVHEASK